MAVSEKLHVRNLATIRVYNIHILSLVKILPTVTTEVLVLHTEHSNNGKIFDM